MGTKYSTVSVSGYNATPPADDGTVTEANKLKWSTIKTKLPDPLKTAIESVNSNLTTHFDNGPTALATNTTLDSTHYNKIIQVSGSGVTLTLTDAATLGAGWHCQIVNTDASNTVTLGRATGGDTINETAANVTIQTLTHLTVVVNAAANGFLVSVGPRITKAYKSAENTTFSGTVTISGAVTITSDVALSGTNNSLTSTDAGAGAGPSWVLDRNSASPAASDVLGAIPFKGRDSGAGTDTYAQIQAEIVDATATSEDGKIAWQTAVAGTLATRGYIAQGMVIGSPTGTDKGTGTINATTVYADGTQLNPLTSGTVIATTSGTAHDFTSIPSWVKKITLGLSAVSTDSTSKLAIQLGDSGGVENTGYASDVGESLATTAYFPITSAVGNATWSYSGVVVLMLIDSSTNTWSAFWRIAHGDGAGGGTSGAGVKSLSGTLDRVRLTSSGGDTFDAGKFQILYE